MTTLQKFTETAYGGQSNRERYQWQDVIDEPGEFTMLDKRELHVDQNYQRKHKRAKVFKMAREWSWISCGTIAVAIRGNLWYVLDGQHRVLAALLRDDIKALPCMVYELKSVADEASSFLKINTERKAMSMVDRFKALLMSENREAKILNELVMASGRIVSSGSSSTFSSVALGMKCVREDEKALRRIWPLLHALTAPNKRITQQLLGGLWYLERHMVPGISLANSHWGKRIVKVGYVALMEGIDTASAYHGAGKGLRVSALGIVNAINRGLRHHLKHTISINGTAADDGVSDDE